MSTESLLLAQSLRVMTTLSTSRGWGTTATLSAMQSILEVAVRERGGFVGAGDVFVLLEYIVGWGFWIMNEPIRGV